MSESELDQMLEAHLAGENPQVPDHLRDEAGMMEACGQGA